MTCLRVAQASCCQKWIRKAANGLWSPAGQHRPLRPWKSADTFQLMLHNSYGSIIRAAPGPTPQHGRDPETWKSNYPFWSGYSLLLFRTGHGSPGQTHSRRRHKGTDLLQVSTRWRYKRWWQNTLWVPDSAFYLPKCHLLFLVSSNNPARQLTR